jgi:hypothetical protein
MCFDACGCINRPVMRLAEQLPNSSKQFANTSPLATGDGKLLRAEFRIRTRWIPRRLNIRAT